MTGAEKYTEDQSACGIKVGDRVKVLRKAKDYERGWNNTWGFLMDRSIGKEFIVQDVPNAAGVRLGGSYSYPWFVLEKVLSINDHVISERNTSMSNWKRFNVLVTKKQDKDDKSKPVIVFEGKIWSTDKEVQVDIGRLPKMKDHSPQAVEVAVNCQFRD